MKFSLWWIVGAIVIPCVIYLALTAGTVLLLPKEWNAIEPGMTRAEVHEAIPELITEYQFNPDEEDLSIVGGHKIGLRSWTMLISYDDGRVNRVKRYSTDPHSRFLYRIWPNEEVRYYR